MERFENINSLVRKGSSVKWGLWKVWLLKQPGTLPKDNKKDPLRASQELARPHPSQAEGCQSRNCLIFLRECQDAPLLQSHLRSCFLRNNLTMLKYSSMRDYYSHSPNNLAPAPTVVDLALSTWCWFYRHAGYKNWGSWRLLQISEFSQEGQAMYVRVGIPALSPHKGDM